MYLHNDRAISDAKALANTAVRGAILIAWQLIDGAQNPVTPVITPALPKESVRKSEDDPTGRGGIAGGAHEGVVPSGAEKNVDVALKDRESAPKVEYAKKRMARIDGAAYSVLKSFVPAEYKDAFERFDALVLDPEKSADEQEDLEIEDLDMKTRADVQFGAGVALIYLESVLRA
jgi:hypothetical protein